MKGFIIDYHTPTHYYQFLKDLISESDVSTLPEVCPKAEF